MGYAGEALRAPHAPFKIRILPPLYSHRTRSSRARMHMQAKESLTPDLGLPCCFGTLGPGGSTGDLQLKMEPEEVWSR